jgi:hypothetical protein
VVLGYNTITDPNRQFLMNFGWGGGDNGWWVFDDFQHNPAPHDMMTRIAPSNVKFVGAATAGDGSPSSPYLDLAQARTLAPAGSTLMLKASSVNHFVGTIDRHLVINGWKATVQ